LVDSIGQAAVMTDMLDTVSCAEVGSGPMLGGDWERGGV
jgi:hypothetical protein